MVRQVRELPDRQRRGHRPSAAHPDYVDYEAELAVVIGRTAHRVEEADALSHVAGAMPFNDVSARDLQLQNPLWTSGKAVDTFAPCGPALVTLDEAGDLGSLGLRTRINGKVVQEGNTSNLIFSVASAVAWLSRTITLVPGDIIATGTPAGVGGPQGIFLRDGDTVEVEVDAARSPHQSRTRRIGARAITSKHRYDVCHQRHVNTIIWIAQAFSQPYSSPPAS